MRKLTIQDCFKVRSINQAATTIALKVAFNQRKGYGTGSDGKTFWDSIINIDKELSRLNGQLQNKTFSFH